MKESRKSQLEAVLGMALPNSALALRLWQLSVIQGARFARCPVSRSPSTISEGKERKIITSHYHLDPGRTIPWFNRKYTGELLPWAAGSWIVRQIQLDL